MFPIRVFIAVVAASLLSLSVVAPASAAVRHPPACAAIAFRPVPPGLTDGEQDAGLYRSRFGRIEVKAAIKAGEVRNYFVEIDGKRLDPVKGALPKALDACAKMKRMSAPAKAADTCIGDRLTVLISHIGDKRYILLYSHSAGAWRFCSAGTA
jgi:hypothetical protein